MLNEKVNVEVLEMDSLREDNIMCQKRKCHNCKKVYESFMDEDNVWEDFFCSESCYESYFDYFEDDIGFDVLFPEEF